MSIGGQDVPPHALTLSPPSGRLVFLDAVRGFACLTVVLFHSLKDLPPEALHPALQLLQRLTELGWLGVNVFFAVSGWCIAERLAASHRREEPVHYFLRERALRIYPAYWAALALLLVVRLAALPFNNARLVDSLPAGVAGWFSDVFLLQPYFGIYPALVVSWTLVFELGFYALSAGALTLRSRRVPSIVLLILATLLALPPRSSGAPTSSSTFWEHGPIFSLASLRGAPPVPTPESLHGSRG